MERLQKAAVIEDLSGFGRCSLSAALPILSAMGVQACPLPTAVLSNHTGYDSYFFEDYSDRMPAYIAEWKKRGLSFDAVLTGFLGGHRQAAMIERLLDDLAGADTLVVIDPAMADDGTLYATCDGRLCEEMKRLVARGSVVTPNLTEACYLTGVDYAALAAKCGQADYTEAVAAVAEKLLAIGAKRAVITGVAVGERICNVVADGVENTRFVVSTPMVSPSYAGTGDVFAAVLCGKLMQGRTLKEAVTFAADYVAKVTAATKQYGLPTTDGIVFEKYISDLCREENR